jgi:YgiT-type zinc finger domain-containing protein
LSEDETACPICGTELEEDTIPIRVERHGQEVLRLMVPAQVCPTCEQVSFEDEMTEAVIAALEEHTEPGDDIIFPSDTTLH